jgi:hypothetical protein
MKLFILTINVIFFFWLATILYPGKWQETESTSQRYEVEGITRPEDLALSENYLYILKEQSIIQWDIDKREPVSTEQVDTQTVADADGGNLYLCSWDNFEISSPEEFSTVIYWRKFPEEENELWLNRTVKPVRCLNDRVVVMNAYPTLEEKYFEVDVQTEEMKEIEKEEIDTDLENVEVDSEGRIWVRHEIGNNFLSRVGIFLGLLK